MKMESKKKYCGCFGRGRVWKVVKTHQRVVETRLWSLEPGIDSSGRWKATNESQRLVGGRFERKSRCLVVVPRVTEHHMVIPCDMSHNMSQTRMTHENHYPYPR